MEVRAERGQDLIRCAGDALREPSSDVPTLLERVAIAVGSRACVAVRCVRRAPMIEAAWASSDGWMHRTVVAAELSREAVRKLDEDSLAAQARAAIPELPAHGWRIGRAYTEPFVVALSAPDVPLISTTIDAFATALNLVIAHDLAAASARMNALLCERARIASDIHQGVCQEIATLNLQLQILDEVLARDPSSAASLLTEIERSAQLCAESLRSAIVHLAPATPDGDWLDGSLRKMVSDFCETWDMTITFEVVGAMRVIDEDALALVFAFVQEGLTNMRKHTASRRGIVRLAFGEGTLRAEVVDNVDHGGRPENVPSSTPLGHGLSLMRARARLLGGDVRLMRSGPHAARLSLEIPI